jgi:hypothetical protein
LKILHSHIVPHWDRFPFLPRSPRFIVSHSVALQLKRLSLKTQIGIILSLATFLWGSMEWSWFDTLDIQKL